MTITTTTLTRAAGLSAVAAGLLFIAVQINHPTVDLALVTTTEWKVRQTVKVLMAVPVARRHHRHVPAPGEADRRARPARIPHLRRRLPHHAEHRSHWPGCHPVHRAQRPPATSATSSPRPPAARPTGDIGLMQPLSVAAGFTFIGGGLLFGIALFRANILARWAAVVLAAGSVATIAIPLLPQVNQRLFAIPTGIALIGLGYSLWREQRTPADRPMPSSVGSPLDPAGAK